MRHSRFSVLIALALALGAVAAPVPAGPPRVVQAIPDDGEMNVDPTLKQIRVEFDQDMNTSGGFSICGGGPLFPKLIGRKPRWIDRRTLVWSVRLEPDHAYAFSVNCPSARNFRGRSGAPAVPYPIRFRTASGRPGAPAVPSGSGAPAVSSGPGASAVLDATRNRKAIETLRRAIDEKYAYADLRKLDWDELFSQHAPALEAATKPAAFARGAGELLAPAEDVHVWLEVGPATFASFRRNVEPNCDVDVLTSLVPGWREFGPCVATGRFEDGIGYVLIRNWSKDCGRQPDKALAALLKDGAPNGLIIDIRPNAGGSESIARRFAGRFVDRRSAYSKHVTRDPSRPGGFTPVRKRVLKPNRAGATYRGRVVVLTGPAVMSSCESFVLMMKQVPGCRTVGEPTYGSSGNPKPTALGNGVTVYLPSWKDMLPNGDLLEGRGLQPDVLVEAGRIDRERGDQVLAAALELLRRP